MLVSLRPKQRQRLAEIAAQRGLTNKALAQQIISRYLDENKASLAEPAADDRAALGTEIAALFSKHGLDVVLASPFDPPPKAARRRPADSRGRPSPHKPSRSRRKKRP
jgi:hypothetical protein